MNEHPQTTYTASPSVSTRLTRDDGAVLFQADTGEERFLNGTGLWIWKRLDGSRGIQDFARAMAEEYDGVLEDQAVQDISAFMEDLASRGFALEGSCGKGERSGPSIFPHTDDAPRCVDISVTGRCNLHCPYCFYAGEMVNRKDLSLAEWGRFFREMGALAVRSVTLSGGEVFVRPDLWDVIDELLIEPIRYSVLTNGTLITEHEIKELDRGKRRKRLDSIQVSIDGSGPEIHDRIRGKGSFKKAARGLRLLMEAGLPVTVRVTINPINVGDLEGIARFLLEDVGISSFGTNDVMAMGAGCENQGTVTLTPRQQLSAMQTLARLATTYDGRITAMAGPLARLRQFRAMETARAEGRAIAPNSMGCLSACGGAFTKLSVHHDGAVTPCNILPSMILGRINLDSLSSIWRTHPSLAALRTRKDTRLQDIPGCEDCVWAPYCSGSCPGVPYETTGDFKKVNPEDCYRRFLLAVGAKNLDEAMGKPLLPH